MNTTWWSVVVLLADLLDAFAGGGAAGAFAGGGAAGAFAGGVRRGVPTISGIASLIGVDLTLKRTSGGSSSIGPR